MKVTYLIFHTLTYRVFTTISSSVGPAVGHPDFTPPSTPSDWGFPTHTGVVRVRVPRTKSGPGITHESFTSVSSFDSVPRPLHSITGPTFLRGCTRLGRQGNQGTGGPPWKGSGPVAVEGGLSHNSRPRVCGRVRRANRVGVSPQSARLLSRPGQRVEGGRRARQTPHLPDPGLVKTFPSVLVPGL